MRASESASKIRMWQLGLGPMGRHLIAGAVDRGFEIAGASDPAYVGESVGDLVERPDLDPIEIESEGVGEPVDLVQVATVSDPEAVASQIEEVVSSAEAVVTTCEALAWPFGEHRALRRRLDEAARAEETRVLAAGVNPGFAMDLFPVFASGASSDIEEIEVVRHAGVSERRGPLQKKVGAGMSAEEFERAAQRGEIGHRGLEASMRLIASGLNWEIDRVEEHLEGVAAETDYETDHVTIEAGQMRGVRHVAKGYVAGRASPVLHHELVLAVGVDEMVDRVAIDGAPPLRFEVPGGLPGDVCTVNVALNYAGVLLEARPGFHTVIDLPVPRPPS